TVGDELELVLRDRAAARDLPALEGDPCGDEVGDPRTTRVDRVRELDDELEAHGVAEAEPRGGARGEGTRGARVTGRIHLDLVARHDTLGDLGELRAELHEGIVPDALRAVLVRVRHEVLRAQDARRGRGDLDDV